MHRAPLPAHNDTAGLSYNQCLTAEQEYWHQDTYGEPLSMCRGPNPNHGPVPHEQIEAIAPFLLPKRGCRVLCIAPQKVPSEIHRNREWFVESPLRLFLYPW